VEEVPAAAAVQTDTSATLAEEPDLKKVGDDGKPGQKAKVSAAAQDAGFSDRGSFVVQVSVFKNKRQAASLVEKLANEGYPAYVAEVESPTPDMSGTYHRVRIGRFQRIADARAFGENTLKAQGYSFWVDNKKNDLVGGSGEPAYAAPVSRPPPLVEPREPREPSEPSVPSEPTEEAFGTPKAPPAAATPAETTPAPTPASATRPPEPEAKPDSGKINLDEW
jgi:hypothetical protein